MMTCEMNRPFALQRANAFSKLGDAICIFLRRLFAINDDTPLGMDDVMAARLYR